MATLAQVLAQGWIPPTYRKPAQGLQAQAYTLQRSLARYMHLTTLKEERARNIRAAARRYNRKIGMPLARLPFWVSHRKAKAKQ